MPGPTPVTPALDTDALDQAIVTRLGNVASTIFHVDRGRQFSDRKTEQLCLSVEPRESQEGRMVPSRR